MLPRCRFTQTFVPLHCFCSDRPPGPRLALCLSRGTKGLTLTRGAGDGLLLLESELMRGACLELSWRMQAAQAGEKPAGQRGCWAVPPGCGLLPPAQSHRVLPPTRSSSQTSRAGPEQPGEWRSRCPGDLSSPGGRARGLCPARARSGRGAARAREVPLSPQQRLAQIA